MNAPLIQPACPVCKNILLTNILPSCTFVYARVWLWRCSNDEGDQGMRHWQHWRGLCPEALQCDAWCHAFCAWFQIYEHLQSVATVVLYVQVACALVGSLGRFYSGVPVADLAIALFALVAIESGSHLLFRVYIVLLGCSLLVDIFWFVLIAKELRNITVLGKFSAFALHTMLVFQISSSTIRLLSTFIWFHIYQQGMSTSDASSYQPINFDARLGSLGEAPDFNTFWPPEVSPDSEILGGSIYDPAYYSSLFDSSSKLLEDGEGLKEQLILT